MNYEKFLSISTALSDYIKKHRNAFIDFVHLLDANLISYENIEYYRDIREAYLKSQPCKGEKRINPNIVVCMLIILKYPDETFENALSEKTKIKYLVLEHTEHLDQIRYDLFTSGTELHNFMMRI